MAEESAAEMEAKAVSMAEAAAAGLAEMEARASVICLRSEIVHLGTARGKGDGKTAQTEKAGGGKGDGTEAKAQTEKAGEGKGDGKAKAQTAQTAQTEGADGAEAKAKAKAQ